MECKEIKRANIHSSPATTKENSVVSKSDGLIGLDALPEQIVDRAVQNGFTFNILCVGEPGIGKSTLLESLFSIRLTEPSKNSEYSTPQSRSSIDSRARINGNVKEPLSTTTSLGVNAAGSLKRHQYVLTEGNVRLRLTLLETSGYGDQIDKSNCYQFISNYLDAQFNRKLRNELKLSQRNCRLDGPPFSDDDTCVHVCLYFIEPSGHSIKTLDLVTLRNLDQKVNIVPIIAKADALSKVELSQIKRNIVDELSLVKLYQWPTDDENLASMNREMNDLMPFAVVGSSEFVKVGNKLVRGRQYPWGVVQVENEHHCDFVRLREMLIRTNMFDLIERTHTVHYELYRLNNLKSLGINCTYKDDMLQGSGGSQIVNYEKRRLALKQEHAQCEVNLKNRFVEKVKEKEVELKQIELDIHKELEEHKQWYKENRELLEEKRTELNKEIATFEADRKHNSRIIGAIGRKLKR